MSNMIEWWNAHFGRQDDAAVAAGAAGTMAAKLRRLTTDVGTLAGTGVTVAGTVAQGTAHATLPWKVEGVAGGVPQPVSGPLTNTELRAAAVAVVGVSKSVLVTPVLTVAGLYASGDFVGTSATAMDFTPLARVAAGSGLIMRAVLVDDSAQTVPCELWLFHTAPAGLPADNAAFTITDADALNLIAVIPFNTYYASALNTVSIGELTNGHAPFVCAAADQSIFGVLVTRGAPTYATGQLHVTLLAAQD